MQLEAARAELRSRSPFEAGDLGLLLLRALWKPAFWAWLGFVLPVQLGAWALCRGAPPFWAYLAVWWLKPLYDRAFGLVVGRGLFGEAPRLRALYRALWREGRRGLVADLLWRRFDPARTLVLPVTLLEGLRGSALARRRPTVSQGGSTATFQLASACIGLELCTAAGLFVGALMLLPDEAQFIAADALALSWEDAQWQLAGVAYVLAVGLVEPLFVAAGFGLYLNRRTDLEGWDVELTFRRMARRLAPTMLALWLALSAIVASESSASAQPASESSASAQPASESSAGAQPASESSASALDDAHRLDAPTLAADREAAHAMTRVLARPELARTHMEERWEWRRSGNSHHQEKPAPAWVSAFAAALAHGASIALWIIAVAALSVLIYLIVERAQRGRLPEQPAVPEPARAVAVIRVAFGGSALALERVVPSALALLAEGKHAAALSVLYVGTLNALKAQDGVDIPPQATEGQCLAAVAAAPIAEAHRALFGELTSLWQLAAYAHAPVGEHALRTLCARFKGCFEGGA